MKKAARKIIIYILNWQTRRLLKRNKFQIVAVAGSIGKTSTKFAIATVLNQKYRVQFQEGNYNDPVTVPLVFFGLTEPSLFNPLAWLITILKIEASLRKPFPYDIVVLELGTDAPGYMKQFAKIVKANIGVLTAIAPEHMEYFKSLDNVAAEELEITNISELLIYNADLCEDKYIHASDNEYLSYGLKTEADYRLEDLAYHRDGYTFDLFYQKQLLLHGAHEIIAETQLYSICAAASVAHLLGLSPQEIDAGIHAIKPVSGRMQHLAGINNSTIIDDTYNASPEAVKGALDTLYKISAPQKIAILGNMNELGTFSEEAHKEIGNYCNPLQVELVVTIGSDANKFLAPAAEQKGCKVKSFDSPYAAGEFLKPLIQQGAIILAKGSQNGVFAEETVKLLLANPDDANKLVRQSAYWLKQKKKQFKV